MEDQKTRHRIVENRPTDHVSPEINWWLEMHDGRVHMMCKNPDVQSA